MTRLQKILFIIVVLLQVGVLSFMIVNRVSLLEDGKKILLQCEPVDPRSLFSGDYVILRYKISNLPMELFTEAKLLPKSREFIYVGLKPDEQNKFHIPGAVSQHPDKLRQSYTVVIRGKVDYHSRFNAKTIPVKYGIEQYFVPQGKGKDIERKMADTSAEISVSENGEAAVSKIFIKDKEVDFR